MSSHLPFKSFWSSTGLPSRPWIRTILLFSMRLWTLCTSLPCFLSPNLTPSRRVNFARLRAGSLLSYVSSQFLWTSATFWSLLWCQLWEKLSRSIKYTVIIKGKLGFKKMPHLWSRTTQTILSLFRIMRTWKMMMVHLRERKRIKERIRKRKINFICQTQWRPWILLDCNGSLKRITEWE